MQPLVFAFLLQVAAQGLAAPRIAGTVIDSSGAPIPNATVRLETSGATIDEVMTSSDGRFEFTARPGNTPQMSSDARIFVNAAGFAQATVPVSSASRDVQVVLQPAAFFEAVNVTSSRGDVPR